MNPLCPLGVIGRLRTQSQARILYACVQTAESHFQVSTQHATYKCDLLEEAWILPGIGLELRRYRLL